MLNQKNGVLEFIGLIYQELYVCAFAFVLNVVLRTAVLEMMITKMMVTRMVLFNEEPVSLN